MATEPARLTDQQRREMAAWYGAAHGHWRFSDRHFASLVLVALAELDALRDALERKEGKAN